VALAGKLNRQHRFAFDCERLSQIADARTSEYSDISRWIKYQVLLSRIALLLGSQDT
jgi:hypothetical protein